MDEFTQFCALSEQGNFIPLYRELLADLETPVSSWVRVCQGRPYSFLLESIEGGERLGRYSFLGADPLWTLTSRGAVSEQCYRHGEIRTHEGDPWQILTDCLTEYQPVLRPELPPALGGLFGYWGYELMPWIEERVPVHPTELPDGMWMQVDQLLVFDQVKRKIWAVVWVDTRTGDPATVYAKGQHQLDALLARLQAPLSEPWPVLDWRARRELPTPTSNFTQADFEQAVRTAQEYIRAGDIFQVVLSQRLGVPYHQDPFTLYRSLRVINPSPYMAYFNFGDFQLIGSSPEIMVKLEQVGTTKLATVRPIAGTRRRGQDPAEDIALAEDLLQDPKERAEHIMLVDLGRNDLGRVCCWGTVQTNELLSVERYSHVMHLVSNVTGELTPECTAWDLLKACFPAGTVSGAPKIRAMEIIRELEPSGRGPYSGAYGYYSFDGQLNTAITIRTMVLSKGQLTVQAGAGIVADSIPALEYEETLTKARALLEALRYGW
ncbi:anthranilate synthase component I [Candidatus Cyanaurora vandensis]|uniref:anthranilate synthase component I n=1 Tax=Candidatus Cyanaurora vandensis TaxID=2714958 RepID=UPI00258042B1|nr:anthranilate synthase component I [Candidatus Cyanaurora vandensis]